MHVWMRGGRTQHQPTLQSLYGMKDPELREALDRDPPSGLDVSPRHTSMFSPTGLNRGLPEPAGSRCCCCTLARRRHVMVVPDETEASVPATLWSTYPFGLRDVGIMHRSSHSVPRPR